VQRGGLTVSGVANNNRVVERHRDGRFWQSFDYRSSKGQENIFKDPVHLHPAGGEMIFTLPNQLQGYFVVNGKGDRLDAAVTDIVTDEIARDKTVRTGLSCMRCHDNGMKDFTDVMRPALDHLADRPGAVFTKREAQGLYPGQTRLNQVLKDDADRFTAAMQKALGKPQGREPMTPVSKRFLDAPLQLTAAAAELGVKDPDELPATFSLPPFTALGLAPLTSDKRLGVGAVRRDMWEDYFAQVVDQLGLGDPIVPLDGLTRRDARPRGQGADVDLTTNHEDNIVQPGDNLILTVANPSKRDAVYIEMVYTGADGMKGILTPAVVPVAAGQTYQYPPAGQKWTINAQPGKEQVTVFYSSQPFPSGQVLRDRDPNRKGYHLGDRVVHPFFKVNPPGTSPLVADEGESVGKKTIDVETK
jgi:serine/threonine-protein kinase